MSDNPYPYLCAQLQEALSDSPGGEKAWVPLRRSLVVACVEQLQAAGSAHELLRELRSALDRFVPAPAPADSGTDDNPYAAVIHWRDLEPEPPSADAAVIASDGVSGRGEWNALSHSSRVDLIRRAHGGERVGWLPDPRVWRRHYPEAFVQQNGATHE